MEMKNLLSPESIPLSSHFASDCWLDDACILDIDYFVRTLDGVKAKGVRPDLMGSIIAHYASKWLTNLITKEPNVDNFQESVTASIMKKRYFIETLVRILPPEKNSVPCNFLLRLLRTGNMVGVETRYRDELERRISWQLDEATLKELMIPSFSHECGMLLDVEMVTRLVTRFASELDGEMVGANVVIVSKLVDSYLAEAALDVNLSFCQFISLARAIPAYARLCHDGIYRAVDTYLKTHPQVSKQERKTICRLIDCQKLTAEASFHAAQNERLPVRTAIQVLFSEQTNSKSKRQTDWSSMTRSPNLIPEPLHVRCLSKREMSVQDMEIKKLRDEVSRLQTQMESVLIEKKNTKNSNKGFFKWKKMGILPSFKTSVIKSSEDFGDAKGSFGYGRQTPNDIKSKLIRGRRKSM